MCNSKHYDFSFQRYPYYPSYSISIPGSKIPKWLSHKNVGTSVNLQVPSSDILCNKLTGIVVCVIVVLHHPFLQLPRIGKGRYTRFTHEFCSSIYANGCILPLGMVIKLSEEFDKIESYHFRLECVSLRNVFENWIEESNQFNANGVIQIEVKFETNCRCLEVVECGANLVFEQDIEDLKHTKAWPSSYSITPYNGDGAGTSGEATAPNDIDIDAPHPKWTRLPNLIQRLVLCFGNLLVNLCTPGRGNPDSEEEEVEEEFQ